LETRILDEDLDDSGPEAEKTMLKDKKPRRDIEEINHHTHSIYEEKLRARGHPAGSIGQRVNNTINWIKK
jgi:hypothetical protein